MEHLATLAIVCPLVLINRWHTTKPCAKPHVLHIRTDWTVNASFTGKKKKTNKKKQVLQKQNIRNFVSTSITSLSLHCNALYNKTQGHSFYTTWYIYSVLYLELFILNNKCTNFLEYLLSFGNFNTPQQNEKDIQRTPLCT